MPTYRIGCTGWAYPDWRPGFYSEHTQPKDFLSAYALVFDFAEVDGTFYRAPTLEQTLAWAEATPPKFLFALKLPRSLTHDARLRDKAGDFQHFLKMVEPLRESGKLGPIVAQLPPSFDRVHDEEALQSFVESVPKGVQVAVELRHDSWWVPATYALLRRHGVALVWSVNDAQPTPYERTAPWLYVRFIGDRKIERFDRIQRDRSKEIHTVLDHVREKALAKESAYILLNNHFMGHAPTTADLVARDLGLPPFDLKAAKRRKGQASLF